MLAVLAATAFTVLSEPWLYRQTLFVFLGAVVLSTMYGGLYPGLLALVLAAVTTAAVVISPANNFTMEDGGVRWVLFQVIALVVVILTASRRTAMDDLAASGERLRLALEVARTGIFDYAPASGQFSTSPGLKSMLGLHEFQEVTYDQFREMIHADDREMFTNAIQRTLADKVDYEVDFRVLRRDGALRSLALRVRSYTALGGEQRYVGVVTDKSGLTPSLTVAARTTMRSSGELLYAQA